MKILVIDDENIICESLRADIARMDHGVDYDVYAANCAHDAELAYERESPEIIITDISMPGTSGLTLIEKIRKRDETSFILVLSAYDDFDYVRRAFLAGANDYLLKPIAFSELDAKLRSYAPRGSRAADAKRATCAPDSSSVAAKMSDAVAYIRDHIESDISMSDVAEYVAVSYSHFSKQFRDATGLTFPNYLLKFRMDTAKTLLAEPCLRVVDIAQKVGYRNDANHFSRDFCKYAGVTPTDYRRHADAPQREPD